MEPSIEHTERWVLFQSGQFVHNMALDRVLPLGKRHTCVRDSRRDYGTLRVHRPHGGSEGLHESRRDRGRTPGRRGSTTRMARGIQSRRVVAKRSRSLPTTPTRQRSCVPAGARSPSMSHSPSTPNSAGTIRQRTSSKPHNDNDSARCSRSTTQEPGHQARVARHPNGLGLFGVQLRSARELQDFIPSGAVPLPNAHATSQSIRAIPAASRYNSKKWRSFPNEPYWRQPTCSRKAPMRLWIVSCSITAWKSVLAEDQKRIEPTRWEVLSDKEPRRSQ